MDRVSPNLAPPAVAGLAAALAQRSLARRSLARRSLARPGRPALWRRTGAGAFALVGTGLVVGAEVELARRRTTVNPLRPERATALVDTGVFGRTRNPIYVGSALLLAGHAIWCGGGVRTLVPVAAYLLWLDSAQIPSEEEALARLFGPAFEDYRSRVPRWLGRICRPRPSSRPR